MRTALAGWTAVILCGLVCGVATLLRLAATLEAARPWAERIPPAWAGQRNAGG